jgi:hypothetical protein
MLLLGVHEQTAGAELRSEPLEERSQAGDPVNPGDRGTLLPPAHALYGQGLEHAIDSEEVAGRPELWLVSALVEDAAIARRLRVWAIEPMQRRVIARPAAVEAVDDPARRGLVDLIDADLSVDERPSVERLERFRPPAMTGDVVDLDGDVGQDPEDVERLRS